MATIEILGATHAYELTAEGSHSQVAPHSGGDLQNEGGRRHSAAPPFQGGERVTPAISSSPVLVFIHGWLLSRNYWQPLVQQLSSSYRCLTYDLRGFGDSLAECFLSDIAASLAHTNPYSLAAYANDLKILLEKLEIDNAWLIGHSLGGSIALWGADCCSDVKGVICLNSGGGIYLKEEFERFRAAGQQLIRRRPNWLTYVPLIDLLFARAMVARPLARYWGKQRVNDFVRANPEAALGALLDTTTEAEVHLLPQVVSRLKAPVYFLAGEKDRVMEPKYVRHLASFHRLFNRDGDNVIEISDCGHLSMIECPEVIGETIQKILEKHEWVE